MRRLLGLAVLVGGPLLLRRRRLDRAERVDVYFDDGATVSLTHGRDAEALFSIARRAL